MSYSVLIVDDEPIVREGMAYIIDWEGMGFEIVGSAENGVDGFNKIQLLRPQIVITDIRMPELDGIGMVKKVMEAGYDTEFIILSGYSDFTYAQAAIRLGVSSYLLKPIDEIELEMVLKKIIINIQEKQKREENMELYKNYSLSNKLKDYVLTKQHQEDLEIQFSFDTYKIIACNYEDSDLSRREVKVKLERFLNEEVFYFNHSNSLYVLLVNRTSLETEKIIQEIYQELQVDHSNIFLTVSRMGEMFEEVPKLYQEIRELDKKRYLYEELKIISKKTIQEYIEKGENLDRSFQKSLWKTQLSQAIRTNNKKNIFESLAAIRHYYQQNEWSEREIKADLAALFNFYCEEMEDSLNVPLKEKEKRYILSVILSEQSLSQTFVFLNEVFKDFGRFFDKMYDKRDIVSEMKEYTRRNYHQNVTLQDLGKQLNYSHSYLGKKFRAEEKMSYRTYLDEVRIEEAKRLLREEQYLVYEIAEKVGYSNSDYFYKKFKKQVGISPRHFQRERQKEREGK